MQPAIPLWAGGAPGALGTSSNDIPTLTPYLADPASATGAAMVICPGGAYEHLSPREGNDYALWLNQHGVTGFVLKYRLAMLIEPEGVVVAFAGRKMLVGAAGADHHRGAGGGGRIGQIGRQRGDVIAGSAQRSGRATGPERDGRLHLRGDMNQRLTKFQPPRPMATIHGIH